MPWKAEGRNGSGLTISKESNRRGSGGFGEGKGRLGYVPYLAAVLPPQAEGFLKKCDLECVLLLLETLQWLPLLFGTKFRALISLKSLPASSHAVLPFILSFQPNTLLFFCSYSVLPLSVNRKRYTFLGDELEKGFCSFSLVSFYSARPRPPSLAVLPLIRHAQNRQDLDIWEEWKEPGL